MISSSRLNTQKVNRIISELSKRQELDLKVTIVTWHSDAYKYGRDDVRMELMEKLRKAGFEFRLAEETCGHFAVIDKETIWYGSVNLLFKEDVEDNLMRVRSKEIAGELLEMTFGTGVSVSEVIYTGDVEYAKDVYDMGCMTVKLDQVFISHLPVEEIYQGIKRKLDCGEALTEQELMQLIVLPLARKGGENKQKLIEQITELVELIKDEQEQLLVVTGLLVADDKFIKKKYEERIRRRFVMTKIGRLMHEDGGKGGPSSR